MGHWEGSVFGIGKGPVAKFGKTGTNWERVRLPDPAKEGKKTLHLHVDKGRRRASRDIKNNRHDMWFYCSVDDKLLFQ